jgi:Family of unknown function (DUF6062)
MSATPPSDPPPPQSSTTPAADPPPARPASKLPARDIVDVRLSDAFAAGGCPICGVRARSERSILASIIDERVLDVGFRATLERTEGFCRRHSRELIAVDRASSGILGSSILYGAILERRLALIRDAAKTKGRGLRARLGLARKRPPCIACSNGASAVETALGRAADRSRDPLWAATMAEAAFCFDDFLALWTAAASEPAFEAIRRRQLERLEDLHFRLDGYVDHSSHDRRQLMTDRERTAADEAAGTLGGS